MTSGHLILYVIKIFFLMIVGIALTACSIFSPVRVSPPSTYLLTDIPAPSIHSSRRSLIVVVVPPEASAVYRTAQMAYSTRPYQIAYFSKNRWAEMPTQMLYPLILQSLQNTHYFKAVVSPSYVGRYDYLLKTQLMMLQQDFTHHPARYRITIRAQLSSAATGRIIAVKQFKVAVRIKNNTPYSGVIAANHAMVIILRELTAFSVKNAK